MVKAEQFSPLLDNGEQVQASIPAAHFNRGVNDYLIVATDRAFVVISRGWSGRPKEVYKRYPRNIELNTRPGLKEFLLFRTEMKVRLGGDSDDVWRVNWVRGYGERCRQANAALAEMVREHRITPPVTRG